VYHVFNGRNELPQSALLLRKVPVEQPLPVVFFEKASLDVRFHFPIHPAGRREGEQVFGELKGDVGEADDRSLAFRAGFAHRDDADGVAGGGIFETTILPNSVRQKSGLPVERNCSMLPGKFS